LARLVEPLLDFGRLETFLRNPGRVMTCGRDPEQPGQLMSICATRALSRPDN
jgi:hypothetical protein